MEGENHPAKRALVEARERTVAQLADCFSRDELGLEAFEKRVNDAYAATSTPELEALVRDLSPRADQRALTALARYADTDASVAAQVPTTKPVLVDSHSRLAPPRTMKAILGSVERHGRFDLARHTSASALLGSLEIDLREIALPPGLTELHVSAVLGSVEIVVPADVSVEVEGTGILGSFESSARSVPGAPDAPRLRIVGKAVLGSIEVHARPPSRVELLVKELRAKF